MEPITFTIYEPEDEIKIRFYAGGEYLDYYETANIFERPSGVGSYRSRYPDHFRISRNIPRSVRDGLFGPTELEFYSLYPENYDKFIKNLSSIVGTKYFIKESTLDTLANNGLIIDKSLVQVGISIRDLEKKAINDGDYKLSLQIAHYYLEQNFDEYNKIYWICNAYYYWNKMKKKPTIDFGVYLSQIWSLDSDDPIFGETYLELLKLSIQMPSITKLELVAPYNNVKSVVRFTKYSKFLTTLIIQKSDISYTSMYNNLCKIFKALSKNSSIKEVDLRNEDGLDQNTFNVLYKAIKANPKSKVEKIILPKNKIETIPYDKKIKIQVRH